MIIWGNHSVTQIPDWRFANAKGKKIGDVVEDKDWLEKGFVERVQKRGGEIIKVRKGSSVFSAANAVKDHLRDWFVGSEDYVSMGVVSQG